MTIKKIDYSSFARAELNTFNLEAIEFDKKKALQVFETDLRVSFADLNSQKVKELRFNHFKHTGVIADDYSEYILKIEKLGFIIAGIRNKG